MSDLSSVGDSESGTVLGQQLPSVSESGDVSLKVGLDWSIEGEEESATAIEDEEDATNLPSA